MTLVTRVFATILLLAFTVQISAASSDTAIKSVLEKQVSAWNRGDLDTFVTTYASDCVFVGNPLVRGRERVLERYRGKYSNKARMGRLTFSNLEVNQIDTHSATVLGNFHLERTFQGGGDANGIFSLVLHKSNGRWLIILDHTS